jgi:hypothetical protein
MNEWLSKKQISEIKKSLSDPECSSSDSGGNIEHGRYLRVYGYDKKGLRLSVELSKCRLLHYTI